MNIRVKVYKLWEGPLGYPYRYDLIKYGINIEDGSLESEKNIREWFERIDGKWYSVSYADGSPLTVDQARQLYAIG